MSDLGDDSGVSGTSGVTAAGMHRALARARDGKPLDPDEATILLHARGDDLQKLLDYASRTRGPGLKAADRTFVRDNKDAGKEASR
jgi:FO synthase